jgi:diguanylate cyclase (GGDEF)-like protein
LKRLLSASKGIPKIFLSDGKVPPPKRDLAKEPFTYFLHNPGKKELAGFIRRVEEERKSRSEADDLRKKNSFLERELAFFEQMNTVLFGAAGDTDILSTLLQKTREKMDAETCILFLIDRFLLTDRETGELVPERTESLLRKPVMRHVKLISEKVAGDVSQEGKPLFVKNARVDFKNFFKNGSSKGRICSIISVPIRSKGSVIGVLELINRTSGREFEREDMAALNKFIGHLSLVVERATLYEKMEELVITDDLTKLFNTRYMHRSIETEVLRSNRYTGSVSLIFMDIDYFKHINDNYGHLVGSKVLVEMARLLITHLRDVDIVARYGGDEFVMILPQTPPLRAGKTAERIRQTVEDHTFLAKEGYNLHITASFGVASYPESARTKEDLLRMADEAMYRVKHDTRNGVYTIIPEAPAEPGG